MTVSTKNCPFLFGRPDDLTVDDYITVSAAASPETKITVLREKTVSVRKRQRETAPDYCRYREPVRPEKGKAQRIGGYDRIPVDAFAVHPGQCCFTGIVLWPPIR